MLVESSGSEKKRIRSRSCGRLVADTVRSSRAKRLRPPMGGYLVGRPSTNVLFLFFQVVFERPRNFNTHPNGVTLSDLV